MNQVQVYGKLSFQASTNQAYSNRSVLITSRKLFLFLFLQLEVAG